MDTLDLIKNIHALNNAVHHTAQGYHHSRPLATSKHDIVLREERQRHGFSISYDLKDLFTLGAATQSSILMTGGTDLGKTTLAKLVMNALFGEEEDGWHRIDVDTDFGRDLYTDVDFGVIADGKKASQGLYQARGFLTLPGLILDEINRTHAKIANKLIHVLDRDISLPDGTRIKMGYPRGGDQSGTYQFQVLAINEGSEYAGTFDLDRALRRRAILEIPMDVFPLTPFDRKQLVDGGRREISLENRINRRDDILALHQQLQTTLPLHPIAELFLAYLESFNYCQHSLTGEKGSVETRNGSIRHICAQPITVGDGSATGGASPLAVSCEFLRSFANELCPYVRGITPGISNNLRAVAQGFAVLRATKVAEMLTGSLLEGVGTVPLSYSIESAERWKDTVQSYVRQSSGKKLEGVDLVRAAFEKYVGSLEIEKGDLQAAFGFVGYSKLGLATAWVGKHHQGDRFGAVGAFTQQASQLFELALAKREFEHIDRVLEGTATGDEVRAIEEYCKRENPWFWQVLTPYLAAPGKQSQELYSTIENVLYR